MTSYKCSKDGEVRWALLKSAPIDDGFLRETGCFTATLDYHGYDPEVFYESGNPLPIIRFTYDGEDVLVYLSNEWVVDEGNHKLEWECWIINNKYFPFGDLERLERYILSTYPIYSVKS